MGKYAIVKDGKVINTVEAEPEFAEKEGWVSFTDYGDDGHAISQSISLYVDGKFLKAPLPEMPLDIKWQNIRIKRDNLLNASDINVLPDRWYAMSDATQQAWITYRQELRNLPETYGSPTGNTDLIVWPTKPN
jgi:hypothetical protein